MPKRTQTLIAGVAVGLALLALVLDQLVDRKIDESPEFGTFLILGALNLALAVGIFGLLIPTAERSQAEANRPAQFGFVVGLLAVATIVVFQTAVPFVVGAGAAVLGRIGERRGEQAADESELRRRDATQEQSDKPTAGQRASQGWAATLMGVIAFAACFVLFVIEIAAR